MAAGLKAAAAVPILAGLLKKKDCPGFIKKWTAGRPEETQAYYKKMIEMFGIGSSRMAFVKKRSIYRQFYSDLAVPLEDRIFVPGTTVHIFYAAKMGRKYLARYRRHFKNLLHPFFRISAGMNCSMRSCWCGIRKNGCRRF